MLEWHRVCILRLKDIEATGYKAPGMIRWIVPKIKVKVKFILRNRVSCESKLNSILGACLHSQFQVLILNHQCWISTQSKIIQIVHQIKCRPFEMSQFNVRHHRIRPLSNWWLYDLPPFLTLLLIIFCLWCLFRLLLIQYLEYLIWHLIYPMMHYYLTFH